MPKPRSVFRLNFVMPILNKLGRLIAGFAFIALIMVQLGCATAYSGKSVVKAANQTDQNYTKTYSRAEVAYNQRRAVYDVVKAQKLKAAEADLGPPLKGIQKILKFLKAKKDLVLEKSKGVRSAAAGKKVIREADPGFQKVVEYEELLPKVDADVKKKADEMTDFVTEFDKAIKEHKIVVADFSSFQKQIKTLESTFSRQQADFKTNMAKLRQQYAEKNLLAKNEKTLAEMSSIVDQVAALNRELGLASQELVRRYPNGGIVTITPNMPEAKYTTQINDRSQDMKNLVEKFNKLIEKLKNNE